MTYVFLKMKYNEMEKSQYIVCDTDKQGFVKLVCENKRRGEEGGRDSASAVGECIFLVYDEILFTEKCSISTF